MHLIYTNKKICFFKKLIVQGDHNELTVLCSLLDEVPNHGSVFEVQSSINLIHEINSIWLVLMQGIDE